MWDMKSLADTRGDNIQMISLPDRFRVNERHIQFSPLVDITAYELARIIQTDNSVKLLRLSAQECLRLIEKYHVQRHFLLDGKQISSEGAE